MGIERARRERPPEHPQTSVVGCAQQQTAAGAQHAAHLRQPAGGVGDVLDRLARPYRVEARVRKRPGAFGRHLSQVELWMAQARAPERLGGNVDPHDLRPRARELGGEMSLAAADIEHPLARLDMLQQKRATQAQVGRLRSLGHAFPQSLVVIA